MAKKRHACGYNAVEIIIERKLMATGSLGTAWIQIKPSTKGMTAEIRKELEGIAPDIEKSGSKVSGAFSKMGTLAGNALKAGIALAGASAVAGVIASVKSSIANFANYEQLVGGVDTLFKNSSNQIQKYASDAYKTAQMSANQYMETVTGFSASLLQSLSGDTEKAAKYADQAVIDMADNANKMGTSMGSITWAYQGFAKQNFTMLDNLKLGYFGTKEEMVRLLADAEKLSGIHYDIGSFADITAAIHVIQTELGITGTSAEEASSTISGSFTMVGASWTNLLTGMADKNANLSELISNFVQSVSSLASNIKPVMIQAINGFSELINQLTPMVVESLPVIIQSILPPLLNAFAQIVNVLILNLPYILQTLSKALIESFPIIIDSVAQVLPQLVQMQVEFFNNPDNILKIIEGATVLFMGIVQAVPKIVGPLLGAFGGVVGSLWDFMRSAFATFASNFGGFIGGVFKGAINGVISFIEGFVNGPIDTLNGFIGAINDTFGAVGVNIGRISRVKLPRMATGGIVGGVGTGTSDSNLVALSRGEYVVKASSARRIGYENLDRMNQSGAISGGNQVNNITINGYNRDPQELASIISRKIAFNQGGVIG